jgi:hypothetical protein
MSQMLSVTYRLFTLSVVMLSVMANYGEHLGVKFTLATLMFFKTSDNRDNRNKPRVG